MKINAAKIMEKTAGASVGFAIAVAFFNVALLAAKIVQTVREEAPEPTEEEE